MGLDGAINFGENVAKNQSLDGRFSDMPIVPMMRFYAIIIPF